MTPVWQEDTKMTHTAASKLTLIDTAEIKRIQIGEHIQQQAEKIQEKKIAARSRLRRVISFLFDCETDNPYNLPADMNARLYL